MRAVGWTLQSIANKTGLSISSIKRACAKHSITPGSEQTALYADARKQLLSLLTDDEKVRAVYAALAHDTIEHIELSRAKAIEAMELLQPKDTKSAALVMRGLAAHATTVKAHSDTIRSLLPQTEREPDSLPTLQIMTLTEEDIQNMRREQREQDAILNGDTLEDGDEADLTDVVELNPE